MRGRDLLFVANENRIQTKVPNRHEKFHLKTSPSGCLTIENGNLPLYTLYNRSRRKHRFLQHQNRPLPCKRCCFGHAYSAVLCGSAPAEHQALYSALFVRRMSPASSPCSCFLSAVVVVPDLLSKAVLWTASKEEIRTFHSSSWTPRFQRSSSVFWVARTAAPFAAYSARCRSLSVKRDASCPICLEITNNCCIVSDVRSRVSGTSDLSPPAPLTADPELGADIV